MRIPSRRAEAQERPEAAARPKLTRDQYRKLVEQLRDLRDEERRLMMKEREAR